MTGRLPDGFLWGTAASSAQAEGVDPSVITARYEQHYLEDMGALGVMRPDIAPHATQEIGPMIAMIERLIGLGNAYEAQGHVLFSVPSDRDYGALSKRDRESMPAGARVVSSSMIVTCAFVIAPRAALMGLERRSEKATSPLATSWSASSVPA